MTKKTKNDIIDAFFLLIDLILGGDFKPLEDQELQRE